jgi:hypothetical protein
MISTRAKSNLFQAVRLCSTPSAVNIVREMSGATDAEGHPRARRRGLLNFIMMKYKGAWPIAVIDNMDHPPPARQDKRAHAWAAHLASRLPRVHSGPRNGGYVVNNKPPLAASLNPNVCIPSGSVGGFALVLIR